MKSFAVCLGLLLSLTSLQALAASAYLAVFLDDAPLSGVKVSLDGKPLGETDSRGGIAVDIDAGVHELLLADDDIAFPVGFSSQAGEDVEINVVFTRTEGDEPEVKISRFGVADVSARGIITGTVRDAAGGVISGATVAAAGTDFSVVTGADGIYVLELPRGEYALSISAPNYQTLELEGIRVLADTGTAATVTLFAADGEAVAVTLPTTRIEEVVILGVFRPTEDTAGIERFATTITDAIDVEQLARFGDSDVAAALNRVVGVAVTDNKYATVRGLDGRYISATLNGLLMPSTDPQRRDVQLDLFPTFILGGIEIQKSYSPDQLATTTGGSIKILTRGIPDGPVHKVSGKLGVNLDFTGDKVLSHRESETELLGFDNGLRELPDSVLLGTDFGRSLTICDPIIDPVRCTSQLDAAQLAVNLQDDYNVDEETAYPDVSFGWAYGDRRDAGNNEWGYYVALDYDRSTGDRGDATLSNPLGVDGEYQRTEVNVAINGYAVVGYEYGAANEVLSKTSLLRSTDHTTRRERGVDNSEGNENTSVILQYVERQFFSQAFTGHNEIETDNNTHIFDWRVAYSRTDRYEPDRRQYAYFNGNLSTSAFERRWSDLKEDSFDAVLDYTLPLQWGDYNTTEIKTGLLWSNKEREVDLYRFGIRLGDVQDISLGIDQDLEKDILSYQNFVLDRFRLAANTTDTDSYTADEEVKAAYLNTNTDIGDQWSFALGARYEDFSQLLEYPNEDTASNELEFDEWYPAAGITWRANDDWQLRLGYSETVSYPGLIERSESLSYDPDTDRPIFGNPDLEVSTINNADVRLEYYFSDSESVSLAVFAKDIDKPIERAIPDGSGSAALGITFRNQESAELRGVEVDINKNVLDRDEYVFWVAGNVSYIDSEVELSEDSLRLEGESANGRPLQGQSEWLGNLQLGFDHYATEQKFTLLVNYFDERIFRIARGEATGPEIESARVLVDLTYSKLFGESLTLEGKVKNLFNEAVGYEQNGSTIEEYKTGTVLEIGLKYEFL